MKNLSKYVISCLRKGQLLVSGGNSTPLTGGSILDSGHCKIGATIQTTLVMRPIRGGVFPANSGNTIPSAPTAKPCPISQKHLQLIGLITMQTTLQGILDLCQTGYRRVISLQMWSPKKGLGVMSLNVRRSLFRAFTTILQKVTVHPASSRWRSTTVYDIVDAEPNHCFAIQGYAGRMHLAHNCDYASQEVWIAACISDDANLKAAYLSNDVYMFYAQLTGMYPQHLPIPTEGQRAEEWFKPFKRTRSIAKTLNLSMQFGAGAKSVAAAVRSATKDETIDDEQGSQWVSEYNDAYFDYTSKTRDLRDRYKETGTGIALTSGWRMGKDNISPLSAGNLPVQGLGSCILQRACELCDESNLYVIATLHDAITLLADEGDEERVSNLATALMKQAAREILGIDGMKVGAPEFVHHGHLWLHSEKAQKAWENLGKYFENV